MSNQISFSSFTISENKDFSIRLECFNKDQANSLKSDFDKNHVNLKKFMWDGYYVYVKVQVLHLCLI